MLKKFIHGKTISTTCYELTFDDGQNNGYAFPCDKDGKLGILNPDAEDNLKYCLSHPEEFERFNKVVTRKEKYKENPVAVCECGASFDMVSQYLGACECPKCGKWYNLFGQELLPPDQWEDY